MHRIAIAQSTHGVDVPARSGRERLLVAVVALVVVLLAEVVAQLVPERLVEVELWPTTEHYAAHLQLEEAATRGDVDVVVLGASHMVHGIDPRTLGPLLGDRTVVNAALLGATLEETALWASDVVLPTATPDVLVLGITPAELAGSFTALRTRAATLAGSTAYRAMAPSEHAVVRAVHQHVGLVRARTLLRRPWSTLDRAGRPVVERAHRDHLGAFAFRFDEERDHRAVWAAQQAAGIDAVPGRIELLRQLVRDAQAAGARVVLVEPPVERDELVDGVPAGGPSLASLEVTLEGLADELGVPLLDLSAPPVRSLMLDPVHLSEAGRAWFTPRLARALGEAGAPSG